MAEEAIEIIQDRLAETEKKLNAALKGERLRIARCLRDVARDLPHRVPHAGPEPRARCPVALRAHAVRGAQEALPGRRRDHRKGRRREPRQGAVRHGTREAEPGEHSPLRDRPGGEGPHKARQYREIAQLESEAQSARSRRGSRGHQGIRRRQDRRRARGRPREDRQPRRRRREDLPAVRDRRAPGRHREGAQGVRGVPQPRLQAARPRRRDQEAPGHREGHDLQLDRRRSHRRRAVQAHPVGDRDRHRRDRARRAGAGRRLGRYLLRWSAAQDSAPIRPSSPTTSTSSSHATTGCTSSRASRRCCGRGLRLPRRRSISVSQRPRSGRRRLPRSRRSRAR